MRLCAIFLACLACVALTASAHAGDPPGHSAGAKKSGYLFASPATREMQDDDFNNPAFLWVEKGEALWSRAEGAAGKSCASCHNDAKSSMRGVGASYPKVDAKSGKLLDLEQRINLCRTDHMQATALAWESEGLLGLTTYVKLQSRGMPVNVQIDGPAKAYWEKGKAFYYARRGQLGLACANCHEDNEGHMLRADLLSQGQSNGFPTYRLEWQSLGSLQKRFQGCNSQVRAEPYPLGSEEYLALELFVASRGQGLPIETPSVRK
ncbi:MAG TPA: sulfur oxidation c-type cytochrome SoxA [Candidatus Cybelea sp.]|nr:sulfur oxidation c-type cytochrome SoxA [Candidatus Cybelea sp.]